MNRKIIQIPKNSTVSVWKKIFQNVHHKISLSFCQLAIRSNFIFKLLRVLRITPLINNKLHDRVNNLNIFRFSRLF